MNEEHLAHRIFGALCTFPAFFPPSQVLRQTRLKPRCFILGGTEEEASYIVCAVPGMLGFPGTNGIRLTNKMVAPFSERPVSVCAAFEGLFACGPSTEAKSKPT